MLQAHSIGPRMVALLEQAGFQSLAEIRDEDAHSVLLRIHVETGTRLNAMGLRALENLIAHAQKEEI